MLLTFGWSVAIMAIMLMLDSDEGSGHFPYVDGGTLMFFFLIVGLSQLQIVLTGGLSRPKIIRTLMPFVSNIAAIGAILGVLFTFKAVFQV